MIANDVLRRLRYALDLKDSAMIEMFAQGGATVALAELEDLLKRDDQEGFALLEDHRLDAFLDGLIAAKRGKREGPPPPPVPLNNNGILRKLKIALSFRDDDVIDALKLANFRISKSELSAFFRQRGHPNYRECGDQVVRNFLQGLASQLRRQG